MPRIFMLLAIVFLLTGCSPSAPVPAATFMPAPTPTRLPESQWTTIRMNHSGGIMGLSRTFEISAAGAYTVTDERKGNTIKGQLAADDLSELNKLVASSTLHSLSGIETIVCADCFVYAIKIQGGGNAADVQLNDITLPESGFEPLVTYLRNLIEQALK